MIRSLYQASLPLLLLATLAAQQQICFSIENGPASGQNSASARSTVGVRVDGFGGSSNTFVNPGAGPKELGRQLARAHEQRLAAEYDPTSPVPADEATELLSVARGFVERASRLASVEE